MAQTTPRPRRSYRKIILSLGLVASIHPLWAGAQELTIGQYTIQQATPTHEQVDLLSAIVEVRLPESVTQVGQAVAYLLVSSGYRLASDTVAEPSRSELLSLPLPDPHRQLGPMPLRAALETLAGPAFRLVEDPVHRLLTFERCRSTESTATSMPDLEGR